MLATGGLLLVVFGGVAFRLHRADAAVVHGAGFEATVLGWTSWYGTYQLPGVGTAWCIDHGRHAPDSTYPYRPTNVDRPTATTTAMAWLLATHGTSPSPTDAAAVMLVLHDLMGAQYPYGRLNVDTLRPANLAGFQGQAGAVLARARAWKADALAHSSLRAPLAFALTATRTTAGSPPATVVATLTDAAGHPLAGVTVSLHGSGVSGGNATVTTGADGTAAVALSGPPAKGTVTATAVAPALTLSAFSAGSAAQRVARPAHTTLRASRSWTPPPPATLRVRKVDQRTGAPLAGAVIAVLRDANHDGAADGWISHVTSDTTPTIVASLPPGSYLVRELSAPPGYQLDTTPQRVELTSGSTATVTLADRASPVTIAATKTDGVSGRALPGAVYDLYRSVPVGDDATDAGEASQEPAKAPPTDAAPMAGFTWVGRATSDADGELHWPPQPVGRSYCVLEVTAPAGYARSGDPVCTTGAVSDTAPVHLALTDATTTTSTTPSAPSTTTPAPSTSVPATTPTTPATSTPVPSTTPATAPHATAPPATTVPSSKQNLAFTGAATRQWASIGLGLLLLGAAALLGRHRRPPG